GSRSHARTSAGQRAGMSALRSLTTLAAGIVVAFLAGSAGAANYTFSGKFTSNRGKGAQIPLVGLTPAGLAIHGCGGLTFMSGPGVGGDYTPEFHPNKAGINQRGIKDLGCMPAAPGVQIATTGKGRGGAFTLPIGAFLNVHPMTTINAISA